MSPLVSILIPMRNAEAYIEKTIETLLNQSFSKIEILVVNDGSTDNSLALVESFVDKRVRVFQGRCAGISAALNIALEHAKGDYVCRCDADDLYPLERLQIQVDWLQTHPDYIAVAGKFTSLDEKGNAIAEYDTGNAECDITSELLTAKTRTHLGTFLIKTVALESIQGFREYFVTAEDIDAQLRLSECGPVWYLPQNMYFYRIHSSSITHVQSNSKRIFYEQMARDFLSQRQEGGSDLLDKGSAPKPPQIDDKPADSQKQIVGYIIGESWRLHKKKQFKKALFMSWRACAKKPFSLQVWKNIVMIAVKIK